MTVEIENNLNVKIDGIQYKAEFAEIDEVHLGFEDHGIYTVHIGWLMGSSHHGTGHIMFSHRDKDSGEQIANPRAAQLIVRLMECFGDWASIKGKECLALYPAGGPTYTHKAVGLAPLPRRNGKPVIFSEILDT